MFDSGLYAWYHCFIITRDSKNCPASSLSRSIPLVREKKTQRLAGDHPRINGHQSFAVDINCEAFSRLVDDGLTPCFCGNFFHGFNNDKRLGPLLMQRRPGTFFKICFSSHRILLKNPLWTWRRLEAPSHFLDLPGSFHRFHCVVTSLIAFVWFHRHPTEL